jgi:regulatory protein
MEPQDGRAARAAALDALSRRDHSSEDLRRKLQDKGYDKAVVDPLIERLQSENLLNDRRYVENFVVYHAARGQGPLRIRAELRRVGLQGALVENFLGAFPEWIGSLQKVRQKKFGARPPELPADRRRQVLFLGYRGFTSAQIRTALGFDTNLGTDDEEP